jgi:ABC-type bacteriocin/lantibiotic exporter with double-glycine peptidase domain
MSDIYKIRKIITEIIPESLIAMLTLTLSISILIFFNSNLAVMSLFFIPLYFIVFVFYDKVNKRLSIEERRKGFGFS